MPNLPFHIDIAINLATKPHSSIGKVLLPKLVFGSTCPDIKAIIKYTRKQTHFSELNVEYVGQGVEHLFKQHPNLLQQAKINLNLKSFLIGYISHIISDEIWITEMYFRIFNRNDSNNENNMKMNIMDRAIQLDMDQKIFNQLKKNKIPQILKNTHEQLELPFLTNKDLHEWELWLSQFLTNPFSWDRLFFFVKRMYSKSTEEKKANEFVENLLANKKKFKVDLKKIIPDNKIRTYKNNVIKKSIEITERYLNAN